MRRIALASSPVLGIVLCCLLASDFARADEPAATVAAAATRPPQTRNELWVKVSTTFTNDSSLNSTGSSTNFVLADLGYARRIAPLPAGDVWVELGYTVGARDENSLFGHFDGHLLAQQLTVGARYSIAVRQWFVPHVRIGMGGMLGGMSIGNTDQANYPTAWAGAFTGYALAGFELLIPRNLAKGQARPTVGLVVEAGGTYCSPLHFRLSQDQSSDLLTIPASGVDLGSLNASGFLFRAGGVVRF